MIRTLLFCAVIAMTGALTRTVPLVRAGEDLPDYLEDRRRGTGGASADRSGNGRR